MGIVLNINRIILNGSSQPADFFQFFKSITAATADVYASGATNIWIQQLDVNVTINLSLTIVIIDVNSKYDLVAADVATLGWSTNS